MDIAECTILGDSGIRVSRVGFGVHPLGPSRKNLSVEAGADLMCYAYEKGIRFFDTAQFYETYNYLYAAFEKIKMSPAYDGLPVICSKSLANDYDEMMAAVDEALEKLHLQTIDLFLMHQVTPSDIDARDGAWQALQDAKGAGKVKAIGMSTHHIDIVERAAQMPALDVIFAMYNCSGLGIRRGNEAGSAPEMLEALKLCRTQGKGVFTMKVFGGGNLTSDYQRAAKHVFVECHDVIPAAVIGFTAAQEVDELEALLRGDMAEDYNPSTEHMKLRVDREDCMGCGTCVRICASGAMHYSPVDGLAEIDEARCVSCHYCAIACPERAIVFW